MLVRKATLKDSESIAAHLFLAMEDIVYSFIGEEDLENARAFMLHFVGKSNNQYSYQNCWVAEDEMKVVAAINIYNGALLTELRQPILEYLTSKFTNHFSPEDETQAGEYYIDSLGVDPDHQNKGIGSKLRTGSESSCLRERSTTRRRYSIARSRKSATRQRSIPSPLRSRSTRERWSKSGPSLASTTSPTFR